MNELLNSARKSDAGSFRQLVTRSLAEDPRTHQHDFGDHINNPGFLASDLASLKHAAVLIPVIDRGEQATVLLTRRADSLSTHRSQVAFPGGKIDASDTSPEAAALRETFEEVGIEPEHITVLGRFSDYLSGSGFRITPVIAIVQPNFTLNVNSDEVAEVFEVPLSFLMNADNHVLDSRVWQEKERFFYRFPTYESEENRIWGVTAGIIQSVHQRIYGSVKYEN